MMDQVIIYIHGQGGNADEAKHYESLFENHKVIGIDYKSETPWEATEEFPKLYDALTGKYKSVILIANSIGGRNIMASSKEYLNFVLDQLAGLNEITYRAMMGEYILYYRGKIIGLLWVKR